MTSTYVLTVASRLLRLERIHRSGRVLVREVAASGDIGADISGIVGSLPWYMKWRSWRLAIGAPALQRRRVSGFPPVTGRQLRTAVKQQVERYFRVVPGGVVADAAWVVNESGERIAFLVAAEVVAVTEILATLSRHGVRVDRVIPNEPELVRIDLMPLPERKARVHRLGRMIVGVFTVAACILTTSAIFVAYRLSRAEARVSAEVAMTRPGAEAVRRARSEVEAIQRIVDVADSLRGLRGQVIHDLAGLVTAMPSEVILGTITLAADSVFVAGTSETGRLVEAFRTLRQFDSVRMAAPKPRTGGMSQVPGRPFEITLTRVSP